MRIHFFLLIFSVVSVHAQQKILFVGNSLTYSNDLPGLVKNIALQNNHPLEANSLSKPNYSLEDHWKEGYVVKEINKGLYDFVIVQQGPSALKASRDNLIEYSLLFAKACKDRACKLAFYMVWPSAERSFDFKDVITSYTLAADTTHSILCPAGSAWLKVWELKKDLQLYSGDGFHPSEQGSLLAALVLYGALFNKNEFNFIQLKKLPLQRVTESEFEMLKKAATAVLTFN
jgi:hypothetical protein